MEQGAATKAVWMSLEEYYQAKSSQKGLNLCPPVFHQALEFLYNNAAV